MKQEIKIVLGMAFGDCGKGNTVQYLCKQAIAAGKTVAVVRFCGGAQAGHRVVHNGISHVCSSYGSGTLLGVPTIYINTYNTYVDPVAIINEYNTLIIEGIEDPGIPIIDWDHSRITTPYDIRAGVLNNKVISDGTCGMGIYATFKRYNETVNFHHKRISEVENYYGYHNPEFTGLYETAMRKVNKLNRNIYNINDYDVLIFEGTQGLLLDMDNGFMPHCTPSKVGLNGIPTKYLTKDTEVYLVTRTYLTRHGNGYEPFGVCMEDYYNIPEEISNYDYGYQGKFKIGWFDPSLLNRVIDRHHLDNYNVKYNLVFTHCDCLKDTKVLPILDSYGHTIISDLHTVYEDLNLDFNTILYFNSEEA